ncbi:hypothetical protein [Bradyrhizobium sp. STM 3557]|uniref:hypothetical protein n=1 Tax=Bradyrhizobium sp. STM 3557 TaxID=578920 RepID=UPI003890AACA
MTHRAMAIAPRILLAGVVAGAAAATLHVHPASAADDCLTKPKATAPAGQHWYYRSDRATKRQCWYLGDEASHGASLNERKSAAVAAHRRHQELSPAAADAHAEFASPAAPATDAKNAIVAAVAPTPVEPAPMTTASAATMPALAADSSAVTQRPSDGGAAAADQSAVASRWPDASDATQPIAAPSRNSSTFAVAAADPAPASAPAASVDSSTAVAAAEPSVTESENASTSSVASTIDSSRTRLAAFLGAVALAGFSTSVLLARARARRRIRLEPVGGRRRQIWPADAEIDDMQLPDVGNERPAFASRNEPAPPRTARLSVVPHDDVRYDEQYEVEDLLARYGGQGRSTR